ncbi:MAG: hypothetical protein Kow00114_27050 [Kiloniellaceae bacterium]
MSLDLVKTVTFAVLHFSVGFGVTYLLTGSVAISTGVALIEPAVNTVVFFFHEKAWRRLTDRLRRRVPQAGEAAAPAPARGAWTLPQGACAKPDL